ncbi:hypothetical protein [Neobacillus sp.]|uniref:hypothetical protein n=1 Tax=Neobacillus sp. TaxID=2675273 RepID=UPI00289C2DBB|nr:hypothetical protein [Neobacillus sp.]
MRKINLDELNRVIMERRKEVNEQIALSLGSDRKRRLRPRSKGEIEALNQISIERWKKAVERGEVKKLGPRKFYYDHRCGI